MKYASGSIGNFIASRDMKFVCVVQDPVYEIEPFLFYYSSIDILLRKLFRI